MASNVQTFNFFNGVLQANEIRTESGLQQPYMPPMQTTTLPQLGQWIANTGIQYPLPTDYEYLRELATNWTLPEQTDEELLVELQMKLAEVEQRMTAKILAEVEEDEQQPTRKFRPLEKEVAI